MFGCVAHRQKASCDMAARPGWREGGSRHGDLASEDSLPATWSGNMAALVQGTTGLCCCDVPAYHRLRRRCMCADSTTTQFHLRRFVRWLGRWNRRWRSRSPGVERRRQERRSGRRDSITDNSGCLRGTRHRFRCLNKKSTSFSCAGPFATSLFGGGTQ